MAADTGADTFLAQQRAIMARIDSRPQLGEIAVPTLLVWGEKDGITSRAHHDEIRDAIPGARLEVIAGAGHLTMIEAPEVVVPLFTAFIRSEERCGWEECVRTVRFRVWPFH